MKKNNPNAPDDIARIDIVSFLGLVEIRRKISNYIEAGVFDSKVIALLMTESGCAPVEGELLDYKRELGSDAIGLAKCTIQIVSLHNTYGGYLVFGVEEAIRDQSFLPCGIVPGTIDLQQIRATIRNYTGKTIDIAFLDIVVPFKQESINLGLLYVPKRATNVAPIKFGKIGPSKNNSPLFSVDDVFFRRQDANVRAQSSEDWWILSGERANPYASAQLLPVALVGTRKKIVDENLPDRNLICPKFVGRDDTILKLWQWLSDDFQYAKVLAGDGGKGKTSIAYQFAEEVCRTRPYDFEKVVWLTAKTEQFRGLKDDYDPVEASYGSYVELLTVLSEKLPLLREEVDDASPQLLKQIISQALEQTHTFIVVDDIDTLPLDHQRMVLEAAFQLGRTGSRFLLTTRQNTIYSDDLSIVVQGFDKDDYIEYVHELLERLGHARLSVGAIEKLRKATDGSPLYTESLVRLIRNNMTVEQAISGWKGEMGMKVRRAALEREVKRLTLESRRVLLAAVYLLECSNTELMQVTGYDEVQLMSCIDELKSLFLIGAPRILGKESRFVIQSNTRTLALKSERLFVTDYLSVKQACAKIRSGVKGVTKRGDRKTIAAALTQSDAFLREQDWEGAMQTINTVLRKHKDDQDLLFALAKIHIAKQPVDYSTAKKLMREAYDQGQRKYKLYAAWYDCEIESSHATGAIEVASLALNDKIVDRSEWLIKRAAAYKASSVIRQQSKDIDGAIDNLLACNSDLRIAWPLPSKNQADEIFASLISVGQTLWGLGVKHATSIPKWVRAFDILKEIVVSSNDTAKVAENMVYCVEQIVNIAANKGSLTVRESNLAKQHLNEAIHFVSANRQKERSDLFQKAEAGISVIGARIQGLDGSYSPEEAGSLDIKDFDLFLAHNSLDKSAVRIISKKLKEQGVSTWLDEDEIPPGQLFQDYIQKALPKAKGIAVFVGKSGLGRWQAFELRTAISRAVEKGIPVIPVLLPDAKDVSSELPFLMEFHNVRFRSLEDSDALNQLVWGATLRGRPQI